MFTEFQITFFSAVETKEGKELIKEANDMQCYFFYALFEIQLA